VIGSAGQRLSTASSNGVEVRPTPKTVRLNATRLALAANGSKSLTSGRPTGVNNGNATGVKTTASTPTVTAKSGACKCRPEEFTCPPSAPSTTSATTGAANNGRRKGQLSFKVGLSQTFFCFHFFPQIIWCPPAVPTDPFHFFF
jgi:hypothetical protein